MSSPGFTLFETAIGWCSIAWGTNGIVSVQLPEANPDQTRARLRRRFPTARETETPPADVQRAIGGVVGLLHGEVNDLQDINLDMTGVPDFDRRVYEIARTIPPGTTVTYGEIATRLGSISESRRVGQALGRNPFAPIVPCHRVVAAGGKLGGFSAPGSIVTKLRMLAIEGAPTNGTLPLFDDALAKTEPRRARLGGW
jgi:methylated-DNA-[protein]-cysteine S-methyltransferase